MNEFAATEATAEAGFVEVGETAVVGQVSVEFVGFEPLPEIQSAPEAQIAPEHQLSTAAEPAPAAVSTTAVAPITVYLESAPPLDVPAARFTLAPPEAQVIDRPEPDDSPAPPLRKGTHAHAANRWELAA